MWIDVDGVNRGGGGSIQHALLLWVCYSFGGLSGMVMRDKQRTEPQFFRVGPQYLTLGAAPPPHPPTRPPPLQRRQHTPTPFKAPISNGRQTFWADLSSCCVLTVKGGAKGALKPGRPPILGRCPEAVRRCRLLQPLCHERRRCRPCVSRIPAGWRVRGWGGARGGARTAMWTGGWAVSSTQSLLNGLPVVAY